MIWLVACAGRAWNPVPADRTHAVVPEVDLLQGDAAVAAARACAACHVAGTPPTAPPSRATEHHSWTGWALWQGVALPSDAAWAEGVARLRASGPQTPPSEGGWPQALGAVAGAAVDPDARAGVLADVLGSCAGCHGAG